MKQIGYPAFNTQTQLPTMDLHVRMLFCLDVGVGGNKAEPFTFAEECLSVRRKLYTGFL